MEPENHIQVVITDKNNELGLKLVSLFSSNSYKRKEVDRHFLFYEPEAKKVFFILVGRKIFDCRKTWNLLLNKVDNSKEN